MKFQWDRAKASANYRKHGVSFDEAASVFDDSPRCFDDLDHSDVELRYLVIGFSNRGRLLAVIVTDRDDEIRIISARLADAGEAKLYAETHG